MSNCDLPQDDGESDSHDDRLWAEILEYGRRALKRPLSQISGGSENDDAPGPVLRRHRLSFDTDTLEVPIEEPIPEQICDPGYMGDEECEFTGVQEKQHRGY